jgi:hypothetical protein
MPRTPPYELNAIKYRRSIYEGFLGKSPEQSKITVPTLGSPELDKPAATPSRDRASQSSSQLRPASAINVESSETVTDDFSKLIDETSQLSMDMPSIVGRKKRKPKKKQGLDAIQIVAVIGSFIGLIIAAWLGSAALRVSARTEEYVAPQVIELPPAPAPVPQATPTPPVDSPPQPMPVPPSTPAITVQPMPAPAVAVNTQPLTVFNPATESEWRESLSRHTKDPNLQVYYTFDESTIAGDQVKNVARATGGLFNLKIAGPEITSGRFPGKKALRFNPQSAQQHAQISAAESNLLHLESMFTIAVWFKVDQFDRLNQTLIAKGDTGWRIRRNLSSNSLGLQFMSDTSDVQLNGTREVNDGRWHLFVASRSPELNKLWIYLDGNLDCTLSAQATPAKNDNPIWIGGISEADQGKSSFSGWIDEVAIWRKVLDQDQVRELYSKGNPAQ